MRDGAARHLRGGPGRRRDDLPPHRGRSGTPSGPGWGQHRQDRAHPLIAAAATPVEDRGVRDGRARQRRRRDPDGAGSLDRCGPARLGPAAGARTGGSLRHRAGGPTPGRTGGSVPARPGPPVHERARAAHGTSLCAVERGLTRTMSALPISTATPPAMRVARTPAPSTRSPPTNAPSATATWNTAVCRPPTLSNRSGSARASDVFVAGRSQVFRSRSREGQIRAVRDRSARVSCRRRG